MLSIAASNLKDWLQAYVAFEEKLDEEYEQYRYIEAKAMTIGATEISDMPKGASGDSDKLAAFLIQKEQILDRIQRDVAKHDMDRQAILRALQDLAYGEATVIKLRYIGCMRWEEIIYRCFGSFDDFHEKREMYDRRAYRYHDYGLEKMAKNWTEPKGDFLRP